VRGKLSPWLPRLDFGQWSGEMIDHRRCDGRFIQFDWLGLTFTFEIGRAA
jgi:hypothetical protein